MAWRINENVIRGEIDNRVRGVVRGRLWLEGMEEPVQLKLTGNACRDLAGCLLKFRNTGEVFPVRRDAVFQPLHEGSIGDLTASRKIRVCDLPFEEAEAMIERGEQPPESVVNCLYLEWFSAGNGRVVIEGADYELEVSAPEWSLSDEEEDRRSADAERGFQQFLGQLNDAVEKARGKVDHDKEAWDEFDYENFMRESDARTDKFGELLDKYGHTEEGYEKAAREMGWNDDDDDDAGEDDDFPLDVDALNAACEEAEELEPDPATEGKDWIRVERGAIRHPLQHKCHEYAMALWHELDGLGLAEADDPIALLRFEYQHTAVKMAGALNDLAYGRNSFEAGFTIAYLKRALERLHATQEALAETVKMGLLLETTTNRVRDELFEVREGILALMEEFRKEG